MMKFYVRSLQLNGATLSIVGRAVITSILAMTIGYLSFQEKLSFRWYFGSMLMIMGVMLLAMAKEESQEDDSKGEKGVSTETSVKEGATRLSEVRIPVQPEKELFD